MRGIVCCLLLVLIFFSPVISELSVDRGPGQASVSGAFTWAAAGAAALAVALYLTAFREVIFRKRAEGAFSPLVLFLLLWLFAAYAAWCTYPLFIRVDVRQPVYVVLDEPTVSHYRDKYGAVTQLRCVHDLTIRGLEAGEGLEGLCADRLMHHPVPAPGPAVAVLRRGWAGRVVVAIEPVGK